MTRICVWCKDASRPVNRPRGLCWRCYNAPGVLDHVPIVSKYARKSTIGMASDSGLSLAPEPTDTRPGSHERVAVYEWRAACGYTLFHPRDLQGHAMVARSNAGGGRSNERMSELLGTGGRFAAGPLHGMQPQAEGAGEVHRAAGPGG